MKIKSGEKKKCQVITKERKKKKKQLDVDAVSCQFFSVPVVSLLVHRVADAMCNK